MVSTDNGENTSASEEPSIAKVKRHNPLHISTSQRGLIIEQNSENSNNTPLSKKLRFFKFGNLSSPSVRFQQFAGQKDEVSRTVRSTSSSLHIRERFQRIFSKKVDWNCLWGLCKEWIRNPMNMALFIWIVIVGISGAILFMVMTGMLNHAIPKKSQRNAWFEVNNQILNALFTLMCLYNHPKRIYHLALLLRWRPEDVLKLRKAYCKHGTYKPNEWSHIMVVVALLNLNCLAQYASCGLNLGYKRSERPAIGVGIAMAVAICAPAVAGIYAILSPLGKDYETETDDEEAQIQVNINATENSSSSTGQDPSRRISFEKRFSFRTRNDLVETSPKWSGGVLDFWDDISLAYLSLFCSFSVFGWNMERLGFGNMYVHIATFVLFCTAPFWIFNLAAININDETVREALGITGILLCVFGLLYGGFWRIQMRKRFNLPPDNFCFGRPAVTDCALWLFCCWCALAQEVRTGNSYDIVEDKFCRKKDEAELNEIITPLPRERSSPSSPIGNSPSSSYMAKASPSRFSKEHDSTQSKDETMTPPVPSVIHREEI